MTSYAEFWEGATFGPGNTNAKYALSSGKSPNRYHLMRLFRKRNMRELGEVLYTILADNTPSDTASVAISQVTAVANTGDNVQGGVRGITSQQIMGLNLDSGVNDATAEAARATKGGDVTLLNKEFIPSGVTAQRKPTEANMVDLSGNGGGGKQATGR